MTKDNVSMKILMLTPYLPYPLFSGGQIRSFNLLKNLALKHQITLFSLIKNDEEKKYVKELSAFCQEIRVFKRSEKPWTLQNILKTGFGFFPFVVVRNHSKEEEKAIIQKIGREKFDLIHAETFYVMPHIPKTTIPILLVEQTIEYLVYQHFVDTFKLVFFRPFLYFDVLKIKYWEKHFWQTAKKVVAMSTDDKELMEKVDPNLDIDIVPNGVDIEEFKIISQELRIKKKVNPTILFVGNFKWLQNREAAVLLAKEIWPLIVKRIPQALLWIVGLSPPDEIKKLERKNIKISGNVEDIRTAYNAVDVLLAPIYGPGGTRYKVLEAMASGLPVVTTTIGIEGLEAVDREEVIIKNDSVGLAEATVSVLQNEDLRRKLIINARCLIEKKYNWQKIAGDLDRIYREVGERDRKSRD